MSQPKHGRALIKTVLVLTLLAVVGVVGFRAIDKFVILRESCTAEAGSRRAEVSVRQAENAATIAAVATERDLPARAVTIAIATAMQESKLRNLDHGDRDSLGLFQQRPSQGWGSAEQVMDPAYASGAFYDALVEVEDYTTRPIGQVAQIVQRSAFPKAYAKHESRARALASALSGYSEAGFSCAIRPASYDRQEEGPSGLTARAATVLAEVEGAFGTQSTGGYAPGGISTGHSAGSAHYDGRALDVFYRPITEGNRRQGWATAQWLVAHADRLGVATVIYDERIWTARRSDEGWRAYRPPGVDTTNDTLMHRDHVHVDVA